MSDHAPADRLENQVYRELLDKIRFGTYALGEKLPSEHELCEAHGVSRPVVRAALSKLRDSGLIVSRQGAGSFVNSGTLQEVRGFSALGSVSDIASYFRFRRLIEAECAAQAALNGTPDGAARLHAIIRDMQDLLARGEDAVGEDIRFHTAIAELSGNRFLVETIDMLRPSWIFVGNFVKSLGWAGTRTGGSMIEEHQAIADAIAARDAEGARAAMLTHVDGSERRVFKGKMDGD
ncbi:FadR family transcriptional regulator [Mameliella alba]|nr:FadR family transcriptional regulator [Mameliella alba]MBY6171864.1 FadR family transcriptional regulator [Mameliella alba]MBY6175992.1 FadR family transcriptional regulator [Mameliella alba]